MIRKVKEMIKIVEADGWYLKAHKGTSHRQFAHSTKKGKVTINGKLSEDLDHFLVNSILKQAGLDK
jgi:predicted RNA binding protein YcfA (HicA-like mRNA interferase family)